MSNANAEFIRALLSAQKSLELVAGGLRRYAERRGFVLSESVETQLSECAAAVDEEAATAAEVVRCYLDECVAREGGVE